MDFLFILVILPIVQVFDAVTVAKDFARYPELLKVMATLLEENMSEYQMAIKMEIEALMMDLKLFSNAAEMEVDVESERDPDMRQLSLGSDSLGNAGERDHGKATVGGDVVLLKREETTGSIESAATKSSAEIRVEEEEEEEEVTDS